MICVRYSQHNQSTLTPQTQSPFYPQTVKLSMESTTLSPQTLASFLIIWHHPHLHHQILYRISDQPLESQVVTLTILIWSKYPQIWRKYDRISTLYSSQMTWMLLMMTTLLFCLRNRKLSQERISWSI